MPTLNNPVRNQLLLLIQTEIDKVKAKAAMIANEHWEAGERQVAIDLGYAESLQRAEFIRNQIKGLQAELAQLEEAMPERSGRPTKDAYVDAGLEVQANEYGQVYGTPKIFGHDIRTTWDLEVFKHLNASLNILRVWRQVSDLYHAVHRELLLAGTYEDARIVYQRFHEYVRTAVGEDLPGLLADLNAIPRLLAPGEQPPPLEPPEEEDTP